MARRRAVIVIGSGISRHAVGVDEQRPPNWKAFLLKAADDCPDANIDHIRSAIENGDFLHACEWLKSRFDEDWTRYLRDTFQKPKFAPSEIHNKLLELDSRIVFSLNFDNIYERAAEEMHAGSHIIKSYHDTDVAEFLRGDGRYIVKVHGSLNTPENIIFTRKDYGAARIKNVSFYQAFDACLLTHSFVFLGAGYNDPDIALLLENQAFGFPANMPHYFVTSTQDNNDLKESLRSSRNLKTLEYEKVDEFHSGLITDITTLATLVEEQRSELIRNQNW